MTRSYFPQQPFDYAASLSSLEKVHPAVNKEVSCGPGSLTYLLKMKQLIILEIYQFGVAKSKRRWRRFMQQATKESAVASHE